MTSKSVKACCAGSIAELKHLATAYIQWNYNDKNLGVGKKVYCIYNVEQEFCIAIGAECYVLIHTGLFETKNSFFLEQE